MFAIKFYSAGLLSLGLILGSGSLFASSMTVIDESTEVDSVVNSIELPPPAENTARQASSTGREQAKQAREEGRDQSGTARQKTQESQERKLQQEPERTLPQRP